MNDTLNQSGPPEAIAGSAKADDYIPPDDLAVKEEEIKRLRQGLWDCARIAGAEGDGNETPDHLAYPDIVDFAKQAVQELRRDHDNLLDEIP